MPRTAIKICLLLLLPLLLWLGVEETSLQAFTLTGASWPASSAGYRINANFSDPASGSPTQQIAALQAAAQEWMVTGNANFEFTYQGTTSVASVAPDGNNTVFYSPTDGNGALAVTFWWSVSGVTTNFDIEFFDRDGANDFVWAVNPAWNQFDIQSVATHEFGHALGMGHSAVSGATMFPSVAPGTTAPRSLAADDIAGVQAIYGVAPPQPPSLLSVSPTAGFVDGGITLTLHGAHFVSGDLNVSLGGVPATNVVVQDAQTATCTVPAHTTFETVDVTLSSTAGNASLPGAFTYDVLRPVGGSLLQPGWNAIEARVPADAGRFFRGVLSTVPANTPMSVIDPSDTRSFPLGWDDLFFFTLHADTLPLPYWRNTSGNLDGAGGAIYKVWGVNDPSISGLQIFSCFYVVHLGSPSSVSTISNRIMLQYP